MIFIVVFALFGLCVSSPLGGIEKEYVKEGMDLTELKADITELSREVEEEFKGRDSELKQLRAAFDKTILPNETLIPVPSINDLNKETAEELFEGDLLLTPEQWKIATDLDPSKPLTRRQALSNAAQLWTPMGAPVVYYKFDPNFPAATRQLAMDGMKFWEERTCITFQPAAANMQAYIYLQATRQGCFSMVGRTGRQQAVNLGRGCEYLSIAAHEISHAFGTLHVQSRSDRDNYVTIDTNNIPQHAAHNFAKDPQDYGQLSNYGIPYEFGSMQHYEQFAFAINPNRPTIFARPSHSNYQYSMESPRATFYDTLLINTMYKCTSKCRNKITCYNNGVQHGRDCNKCACPRGWDGVNCQSRPAGTQTVSVTQNGQRLRVALETAFSGRFEEKLFVLQAPAGRRIRIHVNSFGDGQASRCMNFGMDIATARDTRITGYKFCSNPHVNDLTSEGETALVYIYRDVNWKVWADLTLSLV